MIAGAAALTLAACVSRQPDAEQARTPKIAQGSSTPTALPAADDGQWTMPAKDYANTRFSGLDQINTGNVGALKLVWSLLDRT